MKAVPAILITVSGVTVLFLAWKGFRGNGLLGSKNSGSPAAQPVKPSLTDDLKMQLASAISTLKAKLDGIIQTDQPKSELQNELQSKIAQLQR